MASNSREVKGTLFAAGRKGKDDANDLVKNDSTKNCLKNIWHKIENEYPLSVQNFNNVGASDAHNARKERLDLMQWAILKRYSHNIQFLMDEELFDIKDYVTYISGLSVDARTAVAGFLVEEPIRSPSPTR